MSSSGPTAASAPAVENDDGLVPAAPLRRAWVVAIVVLAASVAAAYNQYIVPALLPTLMDSFRLDLAGGGWLVSIFSITSVILALPSGLILHHLGGRATGILALGLIVAGCALGSLGFGLAMFIASRVAEGAGLGLISVVAPAVIAEWFPPERRGAPMGLYAIWVPVGAIFSFNVAPGLAAAGGWEIAWVFGGVMALAGLVAYVVLVRSPARSLGAEVVTAPGLRTLFANRDIWLLSGSFACTAFAMGVVPNFYATYLVSERGWALEPSAGVIGLRMAAILVSCPLAGLVADRIGSWKLVYTIPTLCTVAVWPFLFSVDGLAIPALLIVTGLLGGAFPTAAYGAVQEIMNDRRLFGVGMAILTFGLAVANVVGPIVFGRLVEMVGWTEAGLLLVPVTLAGVALGWAIKVR